MQMGIEDKVFCGGSRGNCRRRLARRRRQSNLLQGFPLYNINFSTIWTEILELCWYCQWIPRKTKCGKSQLLSLTAINVAFMPVRLFTTYLQPEKVEGAEVILKHIFGNWRSNILFVHVRLQSDETKHILFCFGGLEWCWSLEAFFCFYFKWEYIGRQKISKTTFNNHLGLLKFENLKYSS